MFTNTFIVGLIGLGCFILLWYGLKLAEHIAKKLP